jgi:hypothetical protein
LVAYYPFNGNANDASGNANNGTVYGAAYETNSNGQIALNFNGTASDYVFVPKSTSLEPTNAITISLWCKGLPGQVDGTILRKAGNCSPGYFIRLFGAGTNIPSFILDPNYNCIGGQGYANFLACNGTDWQNLIATYSSGDGLIKTYENGVLIASTPYTNAIGNSGDLFIGGATVHPNDGGFAGLINEVRIYNRALSASEIQQLYLAESGLNVGLVAYYPFSGDANDASGNGNNGTVYGAVYETNSSGQIALSFNGTSNTYVLVPKSTSLEPQDAITISLWCNGVPSTGQTYGTILRKANDCDAGYFIRTASSSGSDTTETFILDSLDPCFSGTASVVPFTALTGASWKHLVATYSRTDGWMKTYVNGALISQTPLTNQLAHSGDLYIGAATVHYQDGGFNGLIDNVRLYNRALSASEVQQLHILEQPPFTIPVLGFGPTLWNTNGFNLMLQGLIGSNFVIQSSTDFSNWMPLTNFVITSSPFYFSDSAATNFNQRFYRAVMP